jgi:hypothetical protein
VDCARLNSYGDFATTRDALDFLKKFQRADGKIPHEISQSASSDSVVHGLPLPLGERRRHAALHHRARRLLRATAT